MIRLDNQMSMWAEPDGDPKILGQDSVASHNGDFLDAMRSLAYEVCKRNGVVTSDDLRRGADTMGIAPDHQNAWGAIWRGNKFIKTGKYIASRIPSNHSRMIAEWRLK